MLDDLAAQTGPQELRGDAAVAGKAYRYRRLALRTILADMRFEITVPGPGDFVPAFDMPTIEGGRFRSGDLSDIGPVLLVFGSLTCPMTDSAVPGLLELSRRYSEQIRFVLVNVREAHPGSVLAQPETLIEKLARARQLQVLHRLLFEVAVDDVDGTFHRAMSPKPNSAYVLGKDGRIVFRAHWANDTKALAQALEGFVSGELPCTRQSGGLVRPMVRMLRFLGPVLDRAGSGAWSDMWRVMAPLAAIAMITKLLGLTRPMGRFGQHHPAPDQDGAT